MSVQFQDDEAGAAAVRVRVIDSKPVVVQGAVRHLLRLHVLAAVGENGGQRIGSSQEEGS
jgi:hypothetical protein